MLYVGRRTRGGLSEDAMEGLRIGVLSVGTSDSGSDAILVFAEVDLQILKY